MTRKENLFKSTIKKTAIATMVVTGAVAPAIQTVFADTESDLEDAKANLAKSEATLNEKKAVYDNLTKLHDEAETELNKILSRSGNEER